jgi:large subunit ribosomal protein L31
MKKNTHPKYETMKVACSCGKTWDVRSTLGHDLHTDTCSACHPAFTGKQDTKRGVAGGSLDKFSKKYGTVHQTAAQKKAQADVDGAANSAS